jgi:phosphoribosyl 1,2-cyclic phosphodiesterase
MDIRFLGAGSAFNFTHGNTAALVDGSILIDCGFTVPAELKRIGKLDRITDIVITHSHSDHMGGLETLGFMYFFTYKRRPRLWMFEDLWPSLKNGMCRLQSDHGAPVEASLETYFDVYLVDIARDISTGFPAGDNEEFPITAFSTAHVESMLSASLVLGGEVLYTGDVRSFSEVADICGEFRLKAVFHDCQLFDADMGNVHPYIGDLLKEIPKKLKSKTWFVHYGEDFERWVPMVREAGFPGFVKKEQEFTF